MDAERGIKRIFKRLAARDARRQARAGPDEEETSAGSLAGEAGADAPAPRPAVVAPDQTDLERGAPARIRTDAAARPRPGRSAGRRPPPRRNASAVFDEAVAARRRRMGQQQQQRRAPDGERAERRPAAGTEAAAPAVPPPKTPGLEAAFALASLTRAWLHIKANGGGPGVDGVSLDDFAAHADAELATLRREVLGGAYRPAPIKTVWVPKRSGEGMRPLAKWTIRDRVAQRAVVEYLEPHFERRFLDCSFGFRPGRGVQDAAARILTLRDTGLRWVVDADIKKCFERIEPDLLLQRLRSEMDDAGLLWLLERWIKARIMNALAGQRPTAGTSQGGPISPLLANIYLHPLDVRLTRARLNLVRYADDLVVLCPRRQDAEAALEQVQEALQDLRLELNAAKTRVVSFDQGFQFLGVFFVGNKHHYLGF